MLNTLNKLRSWASFEIYSPLTLPWSWHVESGHCYKLARPSPTTHYVRSTLELTWHLESWLKCHFLPLQQNNTLNKLRQFILSHFWKLRPPDPTQQYVKHVKKIGMLSHFVDFVTVLLKALRSTYEPTWHPESCSKSILYSSKINTLNIRMNKVEMLICLEKNHPLPFQFIHWTHEEKLHLESFCNLQPLDWPYKIKPFAYRESLHVASVLKFTLLNATKIIVEHFGILPTPWPYKSMHSTYGSSWHVDSFYWIYLPCPLQNILFNVWISMASWLMLKCSLPSPTTKPYIEHMKKVDMLSHCYRFIFRPPTKHFVRHMNRLGILSHVWNVFTFPYNKARRWTNKIGTSSHVWSLRPLDHTQQYIQHMDQLDMLMHSFGFTCPVPYETLCLVYEPAWHLYLCQNVPCLPLHQDNTLNTWKERHLESFLKFTVPRPYKAIR